MPKSPLEIVQAILTDPTNPEIVRALVAPDATYVSLSHDNPELKRIMPWAGTQAGPEAVSGTYGRVARFWTNEGFEIEDTFGIAQTFRSGGTATYRSDPEGREMSV